MAPQHLLLAHARATGTGFTLELVAPHEGLRLDPQGGWTAWVRPHGCYRLDALGRPHRLARGRARPLSARREAVLLAALRRRTAALAHSLGPTSGVPGLPHALACAALHGTAEAERRRERARCAWPAGIAVLPPHRVRDLVVRVADGCPNAGCSFCRFYPGTRFRPLSPEALAAHLEDVLAARPDAAGAHGLFLGEAAAASLPDARLKAALAQVEQRLGRRPRGAAAFLDPDRAPERTVADWRALRAAGLSDLTVGLETGEAMLRARVGKSGDLDRVRRRLDAALEAGLAASITVLTGLGAAFPGDMTAAAAEARHRDATATWLARWPLTEDVRIYVARLVGPSTPPVGRNDVRELTGTLAGVTRARVLPYGVEEFLPWA